MDDKLRKLPSNEALPLLRQELWKIADEFNTDGDEIFQMYLEYKYKK